MGQKHIINLPIPSGGMGDNVREQVKNKAQMIKHFDYFSNPDKLTPYRDTEADTHDGSTATGMKQYNLMNFALGSDGKQYAIGHQLTTDATKSWIFLKATPTTASWTVDVAYKSTLAGGASWQDCFIEWQGSFYSFGTGYVIKCPLAGTFVDNVVAITGTITSAAQGLKGADGNLYLPYNNKLVRVNSAGTATDDVCSALPSDMMITSLSEYGSYLAIAMCYKTSANTPDTTRSSKVFIWDYVTTATVQDVIDFGEGALMVLGNVEGSLVGIVNKNLEKSTTIDLAIGKGAMVIKQWSGGTAKTKKALIATQAVTLGRMLKYKVLKDNRLYWVASLPYGVSTSTESTYHLGIWSFGRKNDERDFTLSLDFIEDGVDTDNWKINAFGASGNYWFINHSADGSISRTNDTASYTTESVWETQRLGDEKQNKKLVSVAVMTEPQPTAGQITLKYKKNGGSSFRNIFIDGTDSSMIHEALCLEPITATMTQASPCVVTTASAHGLAVGDKIYFSTTGALLTGITAGTYYYVITTGLTSTQFQFSATSGGSAINTTGTQNGTHYTNFESGLGQYKTIEFSLTSVGGTEITGFSFVYEDIPDGKTSF